MFFMRLPCATHSFCQYVNSDFSIDSMAFHNLTETEKNQILNYELMIYFCEGNDKEKLNWFEIVNIAGVKLSDQELRNAVYTGGMANPCQIDIQ